MLLLNQGRVSDYVIGFSEFRRLIGILAISACMKVVKYETLSREVAVDYFVNELLSQQGISIDRLYGDE